jgi:hypothetical protein
MDKSKEGLFSLGIKILPGEPQNTQPHCEMGGFPRRQDAPIPIAKRSSSFGAAVSRFDAQDIFSLPATLPLREVRKLTARITKLHNERWGF